MIYAPTRDNPRHPVAAAEPVAIQRQPAPAAGPLTRPHLTPLTQNGPSGDSAALPSVLSDAIEARAGVSMAGVSVHRNSPAPAAIGAHAFAQGADIHLGPGQDSHLAHEAWHIAQQRQGRVPRRRRIDGQPVNDDSHLEREATDFSATLPMGAPTLAPMVSAPQTTPLSTTAAPHDAPIQGFFFGTNHAPPADMGQRVAALRQTLADADNPTKANGGWYQTQQQHMHELEGHIHTWFRDHGHLATEDQRQQMAAHLNTLEDHHTDLIGVQMDHNHPLWLPAGTSVGETARANQVWNDLQQNNGNLEINSPDEGVRRRLLASSARLLEGQHGRDMLDELNTPHGGTPGLTKVRISDSWQDKFARARRQYQTGAWATPLVDGTQHEQDGTGIGSYVQIDMNGRDMVTGGHGDKGVPMPRYLTLGHELGHALHNLQGQSHKMMTPAFNALSAEDRGMWSNPEEHANITGHENPLRQEHGLPDRAYHRPPETVRMTRRYNDLKKRTDALSNAGIDVPAWLDYSQPGYGRDPDTNHQLFDPMDATTHAHADAFFDRVNAHLVPHERWQTAKKVGKGLGIAAMAGLAAFGLYKKFKG